MIASRAARFLFVLASFVVASAERHNEIVLLEGHTIQNDHHSPLPHTYVNKHALPHRFDWGNKEGVSYLTKSLNQHLPQYCGSCWAHGALSALADRIKIQHQAQGGGPEINLSVQYVLNCGAHMAGSCHGGSHTGTYQFLKKQGFVPYDTCAPYLACSSESHEGFCKHVDTDCTPENTCRTCSTFKLNGGTCAAITPFPHATIAEYGTIHFDTHHIMAEIYARGPVAAEVNAGPIVSYDGRIFSDHTASKRTDHIVSITGWGKDKKTGKKYWNVRNSWGEYWGKLGYCKIEMGSNLLGIESAVAWATPGTFTVTNTPCDEDGKNCAAKHHHGHSGKKRHGPTHHQVEYVDPSSDVAAVQRRLGQNERA